MKLLKYFVLLLFLVLSLSVGSFYIFNEPLPNGTTGLEADELAKKMLLAVADEKWNETGAVKWEYSARSKYHKIIWDKKRYLAQVEFDQNVVQIDINNRSGIVLNNSSYLSQLDQFELCEKAWRIWTNDSFWLNPISKIFDPGTSRSIVMRDDGSKALLVTFSSGGVTPGDSYLWILDNNFRPKAWKMWVSIIPIGGLEFSWDDWEKLGTGALISTLHHGLIEVKISNVRGSYSLEQLTGSKNVFDGLSSGTIQF